MPTVKALSDVAGGIGIGSIALLNSVSDAYKAPDDSVWLKTGVIETDTSVYPDAYTNPVGVYTGVNFSVSQDDLTPTGITWDGAHFWAVGQNTDTVYQYDSSGVYTGISFSVASQDTIPRDIVWDGTHLWIVGDSTDAVYQYDTAGTYTGTSFSVSNSQTPEPQGIAWDGTYFWVVDLNTDAVYQYTASGINTGIYFSLVRGGSPTGITWDGEYLWVVDAGTSNGRAWAYDTNGDYAHLVFSVAEQDSIPIGITWDGTHFWVLGTAGDRAYQYERKQVIGTPTAYTDETLGLPYYVRVK